MKYVCAWCKAELPRVNSDATERVSHGICDPCIEKHFPEIAAEMKAKNMKEAA